MNVETTTTRRADRLQTVADTIRLMKDAPQGSSRSMDWGNLNLAELDTDRQVDSFNMALWLAGPAIAERGAHQNGCTTIGCIAGTTATLFRDKADNPDFLHTGPWISVLVEGRGIVEVAGTMLGLDTKTANKLFFGPPATRTELADVTREQAAVACEKTAAGCKPEDIWSHV